MVNPGSSVPGAKAREFDSGLSEMIVFSHIPKTAGTSFNITLRRYFGTRLMAAQFRPRSGSTLYRYEDLVEDSRIYPQLQCVSGHSVKPFHDFREWNERMRWFTFLRDPVSRFISHYIHQQTGSDRKYHLDMPAWAKRFQRSNWCVRMIAGEEDVAAARQILEEKFSCVGLVEQFAISVRMFVSTFALQRFDMTTPQPRMVARNPGLKHDILANLESYGDLIQEQNALDQQLYDYVLSSIWPKQEALLKQSDPVCNVSSPVKNAVRLRLFQLKNRLVYQPHVKEKWRSRQ